MNTSFLQSPEWAEFQKSVGRKVFTIDGSNIFKHELPLGKSYLYAPHVTSVMDVADLAKKENAIFVKVEPLHDDIAQQFVRLGYQKSSKNIQPHKTVVLDLTKSEDELLSAMHHKTRYNIRVAEREKIVVEQSSETGLFLNLMKKTTARDKFNAHPEWYYRRLMAAKGLGTKLWVAWHEGTPLAVAMTLAYGDTAYYLHGASDWEQRALMGPNLLHWRIMLEMKKMGVVKYDFWGIDAHRWPGVTRFKLGWGGRTIEYPGAFDFVISNLWYYAYNVIRS